MKLLYSVALPDAILRNPHASMFVFFISAFTLFALAGEDNDLVRAKKKKRSFFSRVFHFMEDEEPTEEVDSEKGALGVPMNEPTSPQEALEKLVKQLEQELRSERQAKEGMHRSMKKEERLRQEAEADLELIKHESNKSVQTYVAQLREQIEKATMLKEELNLERKKNSQLTELVQKQEQQIQELEAQRQTQQDQTNHESANSKQHSLSLSSSRSREKRVFTII